MHYVRMFLVGLLVGILARFFYPGHVHMSLIGSAILGIAGAYLAGFIGRALHPASATASEPLHPAGIFYSILGAILLIFIGRLVHIL